MVFLSVDGIDCYYDSAKVLEGIRLEIGKGDVVGIIGPNGSGKSTLLRAISGVMKPRKGGILLEDIDVYKIARLDLAKRMAVVPQDTSILFDFTAFDVVMMGRNPHVDRLRFETERDVQIVKNAMKLTGSLEFADRPIVSLSAGERQRVVIARVLAQEPDVMLLDEPTSHLDINFQLETMDLLRGLSEKANLAVIAAFHDLNLAARYCKTLILLKHGKIIAAGNYNEVLRSNIIKSAYNVDVEVRYHPLTNSPYIIPLSPFSSSQDTRDILVHVICGGGTGAILFKLLTENGYGVSAGVISWPDSDYEYAVSLGLPVVSSAPFSPIGEQAFNDNLQMIRRADAVLLTEMPIGPGNLRNLEAFSIAISEGKTVICIDALPPEKRDFVDGRAIELLSKIYESGAMRVRDAQGALKALNDVTKRKAES